MSAPLITVRTLVLMGLRLLGVTSLDPTTPANQAFPIEPTDLDDVLGCLNAAFQEYFTLSPTEVRESNLGAVLNAPTAVTVNVTAASSAIASFTGYATWMLGCTIRIGDDDQDNEISSQTLLARPYMGSTGAAVTATVYGDSVQLDQTISQVLDPVAITTPVQTFLIPANTRGDFARLSGFPIVTNFDGTAYNWPFFFYARKSISRPLWWFLESAYSSPIGYVPRRIRLAPMPDGQYAIGYRGVMTATRYQATDVDNGDHTTDPMTLLPINDMDVESTLTKILFQHMSGLPTFKNTQAVPEINRAYRAVMIKMENIRAQASPSRGAYR